MTGRLFLKTVLALGCMLAVALFAANYLASRVLTDYMVERLRADLERQARAAAVAAPEFSLPGRAKELSAYADSMGTRMTLIARDGSVIADTSAEPNSMENHAGRPEVVAAFGGRAGSAIRTSKTVGSAYLYVAVPARLASGLASSDGALRLAMPLAEVENEAADIRRKILQSMALAFLPGVLVAMYFARRVARDLTEIIHFTGELANGNFQARMRSGTDLRGRFLSELALLRGKLNETGIKLARTVRQLQFEHSELERVERVRKDFVINVSHELRTPLASIQGYAETLLDGAIDDKENNIRFLNIIRHNAERLTRLTSDLLILSRLELKTQDLRFGEQRASELLADVLDTLRPIAQKKRITLATDGDAMDSAVYCDPEAFYQVSSNLLDNALKYSPVGATITAACKRVGDFVEFSVRDSGAGIPLEEQSRLFERFYRVDKARSRELGGTGLGLAIVKHLVKAHGGDVRVESEPGNGATFFFTLPVKAGLVETT